MYPVAKRFGNELLDVREYIRPNTYMVEELVARTSFRSPEEAWRWVINNIAYPAGDGHTLSAYGGSLSYSTLDYWETPSEVLRSRVADCEGRSFLLVSILRRVFPGIEAYATVGYYAGYGHVWVSIYNGGWTVMETTADPPVNGPIPEVLPYSPLFRFNERDVLVSRWEIPSGIRNPNKLGMVRSHYRVMTYGSGYGSGYRL